MTLRPHTLKMLARTLTHVMGPAQCHFFVNYMWERPHLPCGVRPSYLTSVHFLQRLRVQTKPPPSLAINLVVSLPPRISSIGEPSRTGNHPCRVRIRSGHPQAFAIADQIPIQFGIISHVFSHCLNCSFTCGKLNNFRCSSVDIKIPFLPLGICLKTPDERGSEARFGGVD